MQKISFWSSFWPYLILPDIISQPGNFCSYYWQFIIKCQKFDAVIVISEKKVKNSILMNNPQKSNVQFSEVMLFSRFIMILKTFNHWLNLNVDQADKMLLVILVIKEHSQTYDYDWCNFKIIAVKNVYIIGALCMLHICIKSEKKLVF